MWKPEEVDAGPARYVQNTSSHPKDGGSTISASTTELCLGTKTSGCEETRRIRARLQATLSQRDSNMPVKVRRQFTSTLVMTRSPKEWIELEIATDTELAYWDEVAAAKKAVRRAKAFFKAHGRWPSDYDPDVDLVGRAARRDGYPDWKP